MPDWLRNCWYVVERQALRFGRKMRYRGLAKAHAWHILQPVAYNLKRLPKIYTKPIQPHRKLSPCRQQIVAMSHYFRNFLD